ncbi:hypothetical protein [Microbulbifer sp. SAOS-129_SWC]|uniref:hypothetical protein n=1 Tax=Microbulbifer sp. SAOS-129_SWC TaxID=3145235 RepID=UPI0032175070
MNNNPYEAPSAELGHLAQREPGEIYSPNQITAGSFLGGPIAAIYFLRSNYLIIGKLEHAKKVLVFGILFIIILIGIIPFVPENLPNLFIPFVYTLAAKQIAAATQPSREEIDKDTRYSFPSNWKVLGITLISAIIFIIVLAAAMFFMDGIGLINLS